MEPIVRSATTVSLSFLLGAGAAAVATLAMDLVMARLPEGETPPFVAAGVLTDRRPGRAPARLASVVHYLAGGLTGPLFVWLLLAVESVRGPHSAASVALTTVGLLVLMIGFFVVVVLPRSRVAADRTSAIRRDWALSAVAYLVVLAPLVAVGITALPS